MNQIIFQYVCILWIRHLFASLLNFKVLNSQVYVPIELCNICILSYLIKAPLNGLNTNHRHRPAGQQIRHFQEMLLEQVSNSFFLNFSSHLKSLLFCLTWQWFKVLKSVYFKWNWKLLTNINTNFFSFIFFSGLYKGYFGQKMQARPHKRDN